MPEGTNLRSFHPRDARGADYVISASPGLGLWALLRPSLLLSSHQLPVLLATGASSVSSSSSPPSSSSLRSTTTTSTPPSSILLHHQLLVLLATGSSLSSLRSSYAGPDSCRQVLWFRVFGWVGRITQSLTPSKCRYRLALRHRPADESAPISTLRLLFRP
ncbi:hypothetical protein QCA50_007897 [Cerrena zonata]|uniref:Uncharacterized protein n=1 Tax=Cerrena zonata TaxID=2478898 RepID=A0AAW0GID4_9APHY